MQPAYELPEVSTTSSRPPEIDADLIAVPIPQDKHSAFLATAAGLFLIVGPTMLSRVIGLAPYPLSTGAFALLVAGLIFEYIIWTIGLGATLMTGFGRWSTSPPPIPPAPQAGVVAAVS